MQELDVQKLLHQGILAAKAAQEAPETETQPDQRLSDREKYRTQARELLFQVAERDQTNVLAWLWLSTVMDDLDDKATCLNNVLMLEPDNAHAQAGLAWIERQRPTAPPVVAETPAAPSPTAINPHLFLAEDSQVSETAEPEPSALADEDEAPQPVVESSPPVATDCPFCGKPISTTKTVCPHCEIPLVVECPQCNTLMDVEWETCSECGYLLGDCRVGSVYFSLLATAYQQNQQPQRALTAILLAEKMDPDQPDLYRVKGEIQHDIGQIEESIATLQLAVEKEPEQVGPYLSLGQALRREGRWQRAEKVYLEVIRVAPDSSEAHFAYGDLMMQRIRPKKARKHLHQAVKLDPQHGQAWALLGQYYEKSRKQSSALRAYRKALNLLPEDSLEFETTTTRLKVLTGS